MSKKKKSMDTGYSELAMKRDELISFIEMDLVNETTHMIFYLSSASLIRGLHRAELGEWLEKEAASEMEHVLSFSKLLVSLGAIPLGDHYEGNAPTHKSIPALLNPKEIIEFAIDLEQEVCYNYSQRIEQADEFSKSLTGYREIAAWKRVSLFYEEQLMHSHKDLDELRQLVHGN